MTGFCDLEGLNNLLLKVEAGETDAVENAARTLCPNPDGDSLSTRADLIMRAYHGSFDAALALQESELQNVLWERHPCGVVTLYGYDTKFVGRGHYKDTGRSFLLAIIDGKIKKLSEE